MKIEDKHPTVLISEEILKECYGISKRMLDLYDSYSTDVANLKIKNDSKLTHELFKVLRNVVYLLIYLYRIILLPH